MQFILGIEQCPTSSKRPTLHDAATPPTLQLVWYSQHQNLPPLHLYVYIAFVVTASSWKLHQG